MRRSLFPIALLGAALLAAPSGPAQRKRHKKLKPERCAELATSWQAAVREAKLLRMPIVVHSHGFY